MAQEGYSCSRIEISGYELDLFRQLKAYELNHKSCTLDEKTAEEIVTQTLRRFGNDSVMISLTLIDHLEQCRACTDYTRKSRQAESARLLLDAVVTQLSKKLQIKSQA